MGQAFSTHEFQQQEQREKVSANECHVKEHMVLQGTVVTNKFAADLTLYYTYKLRADII